MWSCSAALIFPEYPSLAMVEYAWSHLDGAKDERTRFVAALEIPPVVSAQTAVQVQIVKDM